jgi:hypothetical protein
MTRPFALALACLLPISAAAQGSCLRDALGTMRCNGGSSYTVDSLGVARDQRGDNLALQPPRQLPLDLLVPTQPTDSQRRMEERPTCRLDTPTGCRVTPGGRFTC